MGRSCDVFAAVLSILLYLVSTALILTSLLTDHWVEAGISNDRGLAEGNSHVSAGLFHGVREVDWGLGSKISKFSVLEEVQLGVSFYSRVPWIFMLFFFGVGLFWIVIGIVASLLFVLVKDEESVTGVIGIYIWSILSSISLCATALLFFIQFQSYIKQNTLLAEQIQGGFSSAGKATIGYSFYLLLAAIIVSYIPRIVVFVARSGRKTQSAKEPVFDPTALLY